MTLKHKSPKELREEKRRRIVNVSKSDNYLYCPDAHKNKFNYSTEKKAQLAIQYSNGSTVRFYHCNKCCSYHTTSKPLREVDT